MSGYCRVFQTRGPVTWKLDVLIKVVKSTNVQTYEAETEQGLVEQF